MNSTISILLILVGVSIIIYWSTYILQGKFPQGVRTIESGGYFAFHVLAEILTAIASILGGILLVLQTKQGELVSFFAGGMLLYTSVNGLAWKAVKNRPILAMLFLIPALIAILTVTYLISA